MYLEAEPEKTRTRFRQPKAARAESVPDDVGTPTSL